MKRSVLSFALVLGLALGTTACEPTPPTTTTTAPAPAPTGDPVAAAIKQYFGAALADKATRVARCESSLNPKAVSPGGGNHGLFQINTVNKAGFEKLGYKWATDIYKPGPNSHFARKMFDSRGWQPWGTCGTR